MLRVLDLFSGSGGFSLGLERTGGFQTVAFCEIEPFARRILNKHWPEVPVYDDVRTLRGSQVGAVDVICGGFPCQDISASGSGLGLDGERSGLWREMARIIGEVRPQYVIVENSPNLLSGADGRWMGTVLGDLAAIGYDAEWHVIPASAVGAPHKRERIWIIAHAIGVGQPGQGQLLQSLHPTPDAFRQADRLVDAFHAGTLPFVCGGHDGISTELDRGLDVVGNNPKASAARTSVDGGMRALRGNSASAAASPRLFQTGRDSYSLPAMPRQGRSDGRNAARQADEGLQDVRHDVYAEPHEEAHHMQPSLPIGDRPLERAKTLASNRSRLTALGNAVVPQIPELIGRAILEART